MIEFERFVLESGLTVLLNQQQDTPMVTVNVLYKVGSKHDDPVRTGYAHLFEHLMFEGSINAPSFDIPVQNAGGDSNAFTNQDITNYFTMLPAVNIETALWLEADRMYNLAITEQKLKVQKKVVIEEFKETTTNIPYGMVWHSILEQTYPNHGYNWPTIGKEIQHIEEATLDQVNAYHEKYYNPSNAILVIAGNFEIEETKKLVEKYFSKQKTSPIIVPNDWNLTRTEKTKTHFEKVPLEAIYLSFPMVDRTHKDYAAFDLISDILANGRSARLYQALIKEQQIFQDIDAYITGTDDDGLLIIEGKVNSQYTLKEAEAAIWEVIEKTKGNIVEQEFQKCLNNIECNLCFSESNVVNNAINLAFFESIGDANFINTQIKSYQAISMDNFNQVFTDNITPENALTLYCTNK